MSFTDPLQVELRGGDSGSGGMTVQEKAKVVLDDIVEKLGEPLRSIDMVDVLDRLEEKGLVTRERDLKDRRKVYVNLTEKGQELTSQAPSPLQDRLAQALHGLSPLEQSTIALALEKIASLMDQNSESSHPPLA